MEIRVNGSTVTNSESYGDAIIDSMATYTKFPSKLFYSLSSSFDNFCKNFKCAGKRQDSMANNICYDYSPIFYPLGPRTYFRTFPMIEMYVLDTNGTRVSLRWYPSEYFFR